MLDSDTYMVFIAEDEQPARDLLSDYIFKRSELKLGGWSKNGQETYNKLSKDQYDILFLDINLPVMSGIEVLEKLEQAPYVIFTTAYDEYAIKAFDLGAIDYLLKPFSEERFNGAVDKALTVIRSKITFNNPAKTIGLSIKEEENYFIIPFSEIVYVFSHGRHSIIHTESRVYETVVNLKEIDKKLPSSNFIRIHKQAIVNVNYISRVQYMMGGQYIAFLKDSEESTLTIGRVYVPALREKLTF